MRFLTWEPSAVGDDPRGWPAFEARLKSLVGDEGLLNLDDEVEIEVEYTDEETRVLIDGNLFARMNHPYGDPYCAPTIWVDSWEPPAWLELA